jgi:hypothetical protein
MIDPPATRTRAEQHAGPASDSASEPRFQSTSLRAEAAAEDGRRRFERQVHADRERERRHADDLHQDRGEDAEQHEPPRELPREDALR